MAALVAIHTDNSVIAPRGREKRISAEAEKSLTARSWMDPAARRERVRLPGRVRKPVEPRSKPAVQAAGHSAGMGTGMDLPRAEWSPAGCRHRRRWSAAISLP